MKKLWGVSLILFSLCGGALAVAGPTPTPGSLLKEELDQVHQEILEKIRLLDPAQSILVGYRLAYPNLPGIWVADGQGRVKRYSAERVKEWLSSAPLQVGNRKIAVSRQWEMIQNKLSRGERHSSQVANYERSGVVEFWHGRLFWPEAREFFETLLQMAVNEEAFDSTLLIDAASVYLSVLGVPHRIIDKAHRLDRATQKQLRPEVVMIEILDDARIDAKAIGYYPIVKIVNDIRALQKKIKNAVRVAVNQGFEKFNARLETSKHRYLQLVHDRIQNEKKRVEKLQAREERTPFEDMELGLALRELERWNAHYHRTAQTQITLRNVPHGTERWIESHAMSVPPGHFAFEVTRPGAAQSEIHTVSCVRLLKKDLLPDAE